MNLASASFGGVSAERQYQQRSILRWPDWGAIAITHILPMASLLALRHAEPYAKLWGLLWHLPRVSVRRQRNHLHRLKSPADFLDDAADAGASADAAARRTRATAASATQTATTPMINANHPDIPNGYIALRARAGRWISRIN